MSNGPVNQIVFGSALAGVNQTNELRIYSQDVLGGIRESIYEKGWSGGAKSLTSSKLGSALATANRGLQHIRIYYTSTDNKLREIAYDTGKGWYDGGLNGSGFVVAPYSQIAATYLAKKDDQIRVYVQSPDNSIQEYGFDGPNSGGWKKMSNLGLALPGTSIATTSYGGTSGLSIRTYFQKSDLSITELAYDANTSWYTGQLTIRASSTTPRASLATTSFGDTSSGISLRLYYSTPTNTILEKAFDDPKSGWYDGGFNQASIPGSKIAAISWQTGTDNQIRVYFQKGVSVTAVTEAVYSSGWSLGVLALPPD